MKFTGMVPAINTDLSKYIDKNKLRNGHWSFPEQMGNGVGFIYIVRDNYLKRFYLGKKRYFGSGNVNRLKESNWRQYNTSSKIIKLLLAERPREEFDFICIEEYKTKGTLSYSETWSLCYVEAPTNNRWYNTLIEKVSWNVKEPITERHKTRIRQVINFEKLEEED